MPLNANKTFKLYLKPVKELETPRRIFTGWYQYFWDWVSPHMADQRLREDFEQQCVWHLDVQSVVLLQWWLSLSGYLNTVSELPFNICSSGIWCIWWPAAVALSMETNNLPDAWPESTHTEAHVLWEKLHNGPCFYLFQWESDYFSLTMFTSSIVVNSRSRLLLNVALKGLNPIYIF